MRSIAPIVFNSRAIRGVRKSAARRAAQSTGGADGVGSMLSLFGRSARPVLSWVKAREVRRAKLAPTNRPSEMRTFLLLFLPALALAVLAAHFYRAASWPLVLACLLLIGLLAWPRRWAARLVTVGLAAGAVEWLWTAVVLVQQRIALGQPWTRLALILGAVALLTAGSAILLHRPRLRAWFARA